MKIIQLLCVIAAAAVLAACGSLEKKSVLVNPGDSKERVLSIMGLPGDRQFRGKDEAWQYGQTGAGFGYHDYRVIWFYDGKVTGITSYKNRTPASSAAAHFKEIRWEEAPDRTIEIRQRQSRMDKKPNKAPEPTLGIAGFSQGSEVFDLVAGVAHL